MWIYKIVNDINNKIYIGQSKYPIEQRFQRHKNDCLRLDTHLARAFKKYGIEHFKIEIVEEGIEDPNLLTERESYWIKHYDSIKNGYNETDAALRSGGNTYQSKTEEEMLVIKDKIRQTKLGGKNPHARAVKMINIQTGEEKIFEAISVCVKELNLDRHDHVSKRCRGTIKSPYKGIYKFEYVNN